MRRFVVSALALLLIAADGPQPAPVSPRESAGKMTVPPGFSVDLFASEPDVRQPIAFTIDPRGRLWVVECYSYPFWLGGPDKTDRIIILEDKDGDGKAESRKVFWEGGTNLTGIALGFGGVWVSATPNLLFIPDADGDDVPDGPPQIELDGWDIKAQHNMFNGLTWGPDGWLWGCNGIMSNSSVGKPGTPDTARTLINCGVWRFHPTKKSFEVVAHGTTNPWGLDFDAHGEAFITNCVIPHLYRVIPGAHFDRMYGQPMHPYAYKLIGTTADHIHWAGGSWTDSRGGVGKHGEAGGGHAHVGGMVYLGDNWPDAYRGSMFINNLHGHRVNHDHLERSGSGFVAKHKPDFLMANDSWFRGLELKYGPDGSVYLTDWSDTGECHETDADNAHRENGRIYRIRFGAPKPVHVDLVKSTDAELVAYQTHRNEWFARTSRRILQERALAGKPMDKVNLALKALLEMPETEIRLRALWSLHATGGLTPTDLTTLLDDRDEWLRSWSVRLILDQAEVKSEQVGKFVLMSRDETSPLVRLSLASALQKLAKDERWGIAEGLLTHSEDSEDAAIPLMIWYGISHLVTEDLDRAMGLAARSKLPLIREFLARRAVESNLDRGIESALAQIGKGGDSDSRRDVLGGILGAIEGRKRIEKPAGWDRSYETFNSDQDADVVERANLLGVRFQDTRANAYLRKTLLNPEKPIASRQRSLKALVECREPGLTEEIVALLDEKAIRGDGLKALAAFDEIGIPKAILARYAQFDDPTKADAVATLAGRPAWANLLLEAIESKVVAPRDITPGTARQILAFNQPDLSKRLETTWGTVRSTSKQKKSLILKYKEDLNSERVAGADLGLGRSIYKKSCAQCHKLFDDGGQVGPELTGSDRVNLDYILENVLDPSASVGRDYQVTNVATHDGRLVSGILKQQTPAAYIVQTANERVVIAREDVEEIKPSDKSMMPEGLFDTLNANEIRDLIGYLASKAQVAPKLTP